MKLLHLSDLHLGKAIGNYSLIEDQKYCLKQILEIIKKRNVDVIMIAGDIFDTQISSVEALTLYSDFIEEIIFKMGKIVLAISGNHDSAKRLDVNSKFYKANNYHLFGQYKDEIISLKDEYGIVNFHLIPFISLNQGKILFDENIENYTDIYKKILEKRKLKDRNVLISHCYANKYAIEDENAYNLGQKPLSIGGSDAMDANLFMDFDYVALGHLHNRQFVIDPKIRYAGTFMKYSFDEVNKIKSVTLVDLTDKLEIEEIEIKALKDFRIITGKFDQILKEDSSDDYIKVILEDDMTIENPMAKLKEKFPNIVQLSYKNRGIFDLENDFSIDLSAKNSLELFEEFYKFKMNEKLNDEEKQLIKKVISWSQ